MRNSPRQLQEGEFYGRNLRSQAHSGFRFSDTVYGGELQIPEHFHDRAFFCFLVGGSYRERYGRRWVEYQPGSVAFHPPREIHDGSIRRGRCLHLEVGPEWIERARELGPLPAEPESWHGGEASWLARRLYREFRTEEPGAELAMEGIATELLAWVFRPVDPEKRPPAWLERAADRVHDSLTGPIRLTEIAADLGIEPLRLSRSFRRHYGEAIGDMHRRLRIEEACRRLADPRATIAGVAADLAFSDQSHFTRIFRRQTGTTPGRYRREL